VLIGADQSIMQMQNPFRKLLFLLVLPTCLLLSCNLIKHREQKTVKGLEKNAIHPAYLEIGGMKIKYWKGGQGPAIVFIQGFGGNASGSWATEMRHFAANHTVIAMDILWFGESTSTATPSLVAQREAVESLLEHLQIKKAIIVGQSYGGFIAIDLILHHPTLAEKVVIANCPGTTFNLKEIEEVCKRNGINSIDELFVVKTPQEVQRLINVTTYRNPKLPKFLLKQFYEAQFVQNQAERTILLRSLPQEKARITSDSLLKTIPTLVLWGQEDELFPLKEGQKFANAIGATFVSIPACGHAPQFDAHTAFLGEIVKFIGE
jgi:pimeloyl-ACP methyl ester carboxylesterase